MTAAETDTDRAVAGLKGDRAEPKACVFKWVIPGSFRPNSTSSPLSHADQMRTVDYYYYDMPRGYPQARDRIPDPLQPKLLALEYFLLVASTLREFLLLDSNLNAFTWMYTGGSGT